MKFKVVGVTRDEPNSRTTFCASNRRHCLLQRAAAKHFIFWLLKVRFFSTMVIQVEAKDLRQRAALRNHKERRGRLIQKTDFATADQVVQVTTEHREGRC